MRIKAADGAEVELSEEHWERHIVAKHPELESKFDLVIATLQSPEGVYQGKRDTETRIYLSPREGLQIGSKSYDRLAMLTFVRDGFVVTAYLAAGWERALGKRVWPS